MKTLIKSGLILTLLFAFTLITNAQDITADLKKIEGFIAIAEAPEIGQETLSPDGKFALYTVTTPYIKANTKNTDMFLVSTDGKMSLKLVLPPLSFPSSIKWFPNGKQFSFMLRVEGKVKICFGDVSSKEIIQDTSIKGNVEEFVINQQGRIAALTSGSGKKQIWVTNTGENNDFTPTLESLLKPASLRWYPNGQIVYFIQDEQSYVENRNTVTSVVRWQNERLISRQIISLDISTTQVRVIASYKDKVVLNFEIAADGKSLAFQSQPVESPIIPFDRGKYILQVMNIEKGEVKTLVPKLGGPGDCSYLFSPDGKKLAYTVYDKLEYRRNKKLKIFSITNSQLESPMEKVDLSFTAIFWNENSDVIYFTAPIGVDEHWFSMRLSDGYYSKITTVAGYFPGKYEHTIRSFLFKYSDLTHPYEVFFATEAALANRSQWIQLSNVNFKLASLPMGTAEIIKWKSIDGREIEGVLYKPANYKPGKPYPMITQGNLVRNYFPVWWAQYAHVLASNGYLVFQPNYRGTGINSYGEEHNFEAYYPNDWNQVKTNDLLSGIDYLVSQGIADPNRLGLMGWSHAGAFSNWLMVKTDIFKAICAGAQAGGGDMIASYFTLRDLDYGYKTRFGNSAYKSWDYYADRSALRYISKAKTPTLINVGENDNEIIQHCYGTYDALREYGVPVEMLVHTGEPHMLQRPQSILAKMLSEFCWFEQWIMGGESWLQWQDQFNSIVNSK